MIIFGLPEIGKPDSFAQRLDCLCAPYRNALVLLLLDCQGWPRKQQRPSRQQAEEG